MLNYQRVLVLSLPAAESPSQSLADLADLADSETATAGDPLRPCPIQPIGGLIPGRRLVRALWRDQCTETSGSLASIFRAQGPRGPGAQGPRGPGLIQVTMGLFHSLCSWIYDQMISNVDLTFAVASSDMWLAFCRTQLSLQRKVWPRVFPERRLKIPSGYVQIQLRGRSEP